jgi:hypothetical protein
MLDSEDVSEQRASVSKSLQDSVAMEPEGERAAREQDEMAALDAVGDYEADATVMLEDVPQDIVFKILKVSCACVSVLVFACVCVCVRARRVYVCELVFAFSEICLCVCLQQVRHIAHEFESGWEVGVIKAFDKKGPHAGKFSVKYKDGCDPNWWTHYLLGEGYGKDKH